MFGKSVDKGLADLSAVKNCIDETVQNGIGRIRPISRATIYARSWKKTADLHRIQLKQMLKLMQSQYPEAAST
jgi:hypothetical protein